MDGITNSAVAPPRRALQLLCALAALAPLGIAPIDGDTYLAALVRPVLILQLVVGSGLLLLGLRGGLGSSIASLPPTLRYAAGSLVVVVWLSAALSDHRLIGLAGAATLTATVVTIVATTWVVRTPDDAVMIARWLVIGASGAALFGLAALAIGDELWGAGRFQGDVTRFGLRSRLTRPWAHANVAGMAVGVAMMLVIGLHHGSGPRRRQRKRLGRLTVPVITILAIALTLTYSRGAVVATVVAAIVGVAVLRSRIGFAGLGLLLGLLAIMVSILPGWAERASLAGLNQATLDFAATVEPPQTMEIGPGQSTIEVLLTNDSSLSWRSTGPDALELSARWLDQDKMVVGEHRWPLARDVPPGASLLMSVPMEPVTPDGSYRVLWDLLLDQEAYFLQFSNRSAPSAALVTQSVVVEMAGMPLVAPGVDLGRTEIWRLARNAFFDRPILGVGPSQLALSVDGRLTKDQRFPGGHAHNLLLEPLATWGVLGTIPFLVLVLGGVVRAWRAVLAVRSRGEAPRSAALPALLGLVVICVHGLVEWPVSQAGMAVPFSLLLGIAWSSATATTTGGQISTVDRH